MCPSSYKMTRQGPNYFLHWAALSVNLYSLASCTCFAWSSSALVKFASNDPNVNPLGRTITTFEESWIATLQSPGLIFGSIISGQLVEKLGRKKTFVIFAVLCFVSNLIIAHATVIYLFYIARILGGMSAACALSVIPGYVGEISDDANRGFFGTLLGTMGATATFLNYVVAPLVSIKVFAYLIMIILGLFFVTFVPFVPESPYFFLAKEDISRAEETLRKLRKNSNVGEELEHLMRVATEDKNSKSGAWKEIFSSTAAKNGLFVCCTLFFFLQFMGFTFFALYMQTILEASGNIIPSDIASVIIGILQIISCFVSSLLIDRLGRKILLIFSSVGCSVSLIGLAIFFILKTEGYNTNNIFWLPTLSMVVCLSFFNLGYGPICWLICGEVFSTKTKPVGAAITSTFTFLLHFIMGLLFPYLQSLLGIGTVLICTGAVALLSNVYVVKYVPETKGKSFQEIQIMLSGNGTRK